MSRSTALLHRLHAGRLGWFLLLLVPALGAWWLWHSESTGGGSPLLAKVLVGLGAAVLGLLIAAVLMMPVQRLHEGRLQNAANVAVVVVSAVVGIGAYGTVVDWADRTGPVVESLHVVCSEGTGVAQAHRMQGTGPFHAVIVGRDGEEVPWSERSADWRADSVDDTELVVCIDVRERTVETCYYSSPRHPGSQKPVFRDRSVVEVWVYAAHSGRQVDHFTLRHDPEPCPENLPTDVDQLIDAVTFDELSARIDALTHA